MKTYRVTVEGQTYEVTVEEVTAAPASSGGVRPARPRRGPTRLCRTPGCAGDPAVLTLAAGTACPGAHARQDPGCECGPGTRAAAVLLILAMKMENDISRQGTRQGRGCRTGYGQHRGPHDRPQRPTGGLPEVSRMDVLVKTLQIFTQSGYAAMTWGNILMLLVGGTLLYLAMAKGFEPLLLLPIAFGSILVNLPLSGIMDEHGFLRILYFGTEHEMFPILIFMGGGP
jgi:hypothetical protein